MDALATAYRDAAEGAALNGRRSDMLTRTVRPDAVYCLKLVGGVVPSLGIGSLRLNSDILTFPETDGKRRKVKVPAAPGERWVGLVLLFSTETGEPLAIFPDGVVQRFRVGGASGLAVRHLAREDARVAAIIGTGWQAGAQAMAVAVARPLDEIRCYSPNPESRSRFAQEMTAQLGVRVVPAASPEAAVKGADVVLCATNSLQPVLRREWLEPGMHVGSIRDRELPPEVLKAVDRVIIHDPDNMGSDHLVIAKGVEYREGTKEIVTDPELAALARAPSLAELVAGKVPGRSRPDEITCFLNYHGVGYQFAATGAVLYAKARAAGAGRELPGEWFTETVHP
ncbi:ornithine cyclodeaminase family protein [Bosea sp. 117]|uniref:ornithine cyclodeaminase family protein n=1 Tax=Bosea sp. 117 TaxID=1125973 RepID=UPI0018CC5A0D|nr:ornithine cyclodeaminase family protein [Bosea sp. 117]